MVALSLLVVTSGCVRHSWPALKAGDTWSVLTSERGRRSARVAEGQSAPFLAYLEDERTGATIAPSTVRELEKPWGVGFVVGGVLLGLVSGVLVGGWLGSLSTQPSGSLSYSLDVLAARAAGGFMGLIAGGMVGALLSVFTVRYLVPEGSEPLTDR